MKIIINAQIKRIEHETFRECRSLSNITIPDSVELISQGAFRDCASLENIVLPKNLKLILPDAFFGCGFKKISVPSSTRIPNSCFNKNVIIKFYDPFQAQENESDFNPNDDDQCTFIYTGEKMINQKIYTCNTCHMKDGECICEVCARKCHANHNVSLIGFNEGFCDCGAGNISCHCLCCDKNSKGNEPAFIPGPCTINKTGENFVHQHFYRCINCNYSEDFGCCEICARNCHLGHKLEYRGYIESYCHCGYNGKNCKCVKIPNPKFKAP